MYQIVKRNEFPFLQEKLNLSTPSHTHHTRSIDNEVFSMPFPRVEAIRMNFSYQFVKIWNEIPFDIKNSISLGVFKKTLIDHYLEDY